jgi:hypothetical protein
VWNLLSSCNHQLICVQLYNLYPFSPIPSCITIPNRPGNRPLSEHQESGQSDRDAPKCARQSNPSLLGCTELASQSEVARATCLFATEQSGINGARLYRRIGGMQAGQEYVQRIGGRSTEGRYSTACIYRGFKPSYSTPSISLSLQSIDTSKH